MHVLRREMHIFEKKVTFLTVLSRFCCIFLLRFVAHKFSTFIQIMLKKQITLIMLIMAQLAFAQMLDSLTDLRDGKKYKIVKIGEQIWMAQNLDYHGENDSLGLCYGEKKNERKMKKCQYGRLYSWEEANRACPADWYLPYDDEWQSLIDFAGGSRVAGGKLKAYDGWRIDRINCKEGDKYTTTEIDNKGRIIYNEHIYCHGGTDEFGFAALPGGGGNIEGFYGGSGYSGGWWSATEHYIPDYAYCWYMDFDFSDVLKYIRDKTFLFSVRCISRQQTEETRKATSPE